MIDTLVISGGSSSGLIILGKIQSLIFDKKLNLNELKTFGGTSIGSVICLFLLLGFQPYEIVYKLINSNLIKTLGKFNILNFVNGKGIVSLDDIKKEISIWINEKTGMENISFDYIKKLNKNFVCTTFNFTDNNLEYLSTNNIKYNNMNVIDAIMMSCAIPFLFNPYNYNNKIYIDGGILDNFPVNNTLKLFPTENEILAIEIVKEIKQINEKICWNKDDILPLIFSSSRFYSNQQIIGEKIIYFKLYSSIPFYNISLDKIKIYKLFFDGLLNLNNK